MFDNPTDNHTDIEVPLYDNLRFHEAKNVIRDLHKSKQEHNNHKIDKLYKSCKYVSILDIFMHVYMCPYTHTDINTYKMIKIINYV